MEITNEKCYYHIICENKLFDCNITPSIQINYKVNSCLCYTVIGWLVKEK